MNEVDQLVKAINEADMAGDRLGVIKAYEALQAIPLQEVDLSGPSELSRLGKGWQGQRRAYWPDTGWNTYRRATNGVGCDYYGRPWKN